MGALIGQITVTTEQLRNQSIIVNRRLNSMRSYFDDLYHLVQSTSSIWTGEAAESHRELYQSKIVRIEDILSRYQEHVTDLQVMAGVYEEGERAAQTASDALPASNLD